MKNCNVASAVKKVADKKLASLVALHQVQLSKLTSDKEVETYLNKLAFGEGRAREVWLALFDENGNYLHPQGYWQSRSGCVYSYTNQCWYTDDEQELIKSISF